MISMIAALTLLVLSSQAAAGPTVTITGGADESGHRYTWTITHDHTSPIIYVEFPHHMANFFTPPEGWKESITHPVGEGGRSGVCSAGVETPSMEVKRGESARFTMTIAPKGASRGEGDVLIRFAEGTEVVVRAQVPVKESPGVRNLPLMALGIIFALFLLTRATKRTKRGQESAT